MGLLLEEFIEKISRQSLIFGQIEGESRSLNFLLTELNLKTDKFVPSESEAEE